MALYQTFDHFGPPIYETSAGETFTLNAKGQVALCEAPQRRVDPFYTVVSGSTDWQVGNIRWIAPNGGQIDWADYRPLGP